MYQKRIDDLLDAVEMILSNAQSLDETVFYPYAYEVDGEIFGELDRAFYEIVWGADNEIGPIIILNSLIPVVRRLIRMLGQSGCQHGQRMKARHSVKIVLSALEDAKEILDEE